MSQNKKNSLWLTIQFTTSLIFSLITLKLNFLNYGEEIFGIWILLISFWGISTVVDLGFGTAIVKYIAGANENNDQNEVNEIASTGFIIFLFLGVILLITGLLIGFLIYYSNKSIIPSGKDSLFEIVFILLGFSFYFQYLVAFFRSLFEGFNKYVVTSKLTLIYNFAILFSVIIIFLLNMEIWVLALFYSISSLILLGLYFFTLKRNFSFVKIKPGMFRIKCAKNMLGFSFSVQIASLLGSLLDPLIKYVIGNYGSASIISYYEVARRFALAISGLFNTAFKTILPRTSILKSRDDYKNYILDEGFKFPKFGIVYSGAFYGIGSIFIVLLIHFWFGFDQSILIFFLLSLAEIVNNTGYMVYTFFMGIGKGIYLVIIQLSNNILVALSLILGFILFSSELGLVGYFVSVTIMNLFMLKLMGKETGIKISLYLAKMNINKLIILLLFIFAVITLNYFYQVNVFLLSTILSIATLILFIGEIKSYFKQLMGLIGLAKVK
jgi:O-antigen/teichoic acid export membrane protein